jgi:hypothetical protein
VLSFLDRNPAGAACQGRRTMSDSICGSAQSAIGPCRRRNRQSTDPRGNSLRDHRLSAHNTRPRLPHRSPAPPPWGDLPSPSSAPGAQVGLCSGTCPAARVLTSAGLAPNVR